MFGEASARVPTGELNKLLEDDRRPAAAARGPGRPARPPVLRDAGRASPADVLRQHQPSDRGRARLPPLPDQPAAQGATASKARPCASSSAPTAGKRQAPPRQARRRNAPAPANPRGWSRSRIRTAATPERAENEERRASEVRTAGPDPTTGPRARTGSGTRRRPSSAGTGSSRRQSPAPHARAASAALVTAPPKWTTPMSRSTYGTRRSTSIVYVSPASAAAVHVAGGARVLRARPG